MEGLSREDARNGLADLLVGFGANVQPGQIVEVSGLLENRDLMVAITERCYEAGALHVELDYADLWLKRAKLEYGGDDALGYAPSWQVDRVRAIGESRCATISLAGAPAQSILKGIDPDRLGRDVPPTSAEWLKALTAQTVNWTIGPGPTGEWAERVYPHLPPEEALDRLWQDIARVSRLDEADPVAAWTERMDTLVGVAERLIERRFDRLRFEGPGTDLTVGLLPTSRFHAGGSRTVDGVAHRPNLPTEEVFTTPDPLRTEGVVRSTKPLELAGTLVTGLTVRFEGGRAVQIDADEGVEVLRGRVAHDDGGSYLGEVALVDGESRIGQLDTVFLTTLLDENAASHIALGSGFEWAVGDEDRHRINQSEIHIDFMIGSSEVDVTGVTSSGDEVPILRRGAWQL
ncbi:MAG: aminopeptidase [Gaiellales bacterium]|jgi:aminopeptidase|nr:aminopeptidase [Gaiellales bacterium]